jgi:nucleotide-binding universal stress UspA family protein
MSAGLIVGLTAAGVLVGVAAGFWLPPHGRGVVRHRPEPVRRILVPFSGNAISLRALEAAVRLAKAENAIVMPAFLARVPMDLPPDTPLTVQCATGMPLLEAIEQRVTSQGLPVESRVRSGRTYRDALRKLLEDEHFDRIIVSAEEDGRNGLRYEDLRWMLDRVPAEILILRPAPDDTRRISASGVGGRL